MVKRLSHALMVAGVVGAAVGLAASADAQEDPIRVGSFLAVTGPASFLGDPELKTLEMYIDRINGAGGLLGRPLELIHYDTGADANTARTFVKRLLDEDEVDVILGGSATGTTMAVIPLVERAEIPFVSFSGGVVVIDPVKPWVFKTPHTDRMACGKIFEDLQKRGLTKVGLISGTGGFGKSMHEQCVDVAPDYAIEIVADETYAPSDTDMVAQLTKIKNTEGLQAVVNPGFGQGPAIVTKNFTQLGFDVPLYESHGVASKKYIELAGEAAEGVRLPASALLVAERLPLDDPQRPVVVGYKTTYEAVHGPGSVSTFGGHAYDGLMMYKAAVEAAGTTEPAAVRDALESLSGFMGTAGRVTMSADDHMGLDLTAFRMLEIRDGDWVLVE
ncbi:ABC transporter substrate-binding protein [Roseospira marina]|uniref:ABC transporter substrate-binding protein n=1 Tax=Roseospira marina TaxID=140057 RepID=A0A5M6IE79_9PROT|nr:ABC transporter substrate-binding protein [Roseospira marina]KAA5606591.1 ABC transporter substrate-binding protein [Roseospira marina]MBB4314011.1 branched-chain amino acid transport system substrate-binding protein [Roseospira marina]MBB5087173.1 branched-chain amino acid transport system substrate-binding protein [Roseospira marina]